MHVLVTRPEPDDEALKSQLEALGHKVSLSPLLYIEYENQPLDLSGVGALAVTSRNALRALSNTAAFESAKRLPLFAVGPGTLKLAHEMGFRDTIDGGGTALQLVLKISAYAPNLHGTLLHLTGNHRAADLEGLLRRHGLDVRSVVVYRSVAANGFAPGIASLLSSGDINGVVLMSPRTARTYQTIMTELGLAEQAANIEHLCLSEAVASALDNLAAKKVSVATAPNSQEMLALITRVAAKLA